jgi:hypothetical protein
MTTGTVLEWKLRAKRSRTATQKHETAPSPGVNAKTSEFTVFRTLFESGRDNDFDAVAETIADDCKWVLMSNMTSFKGKKDVVALCKAGKLASEKNPEIISDRATSEWGVFEYMNRAVITESLSALAATSGWQFPADPSTLVGRKYEVPVCFVYNIDAQGKIYRVHEYLDLASLMEQFE